MKLYLKITAVLLAGLVFISSSSAVIYQHYCGNQLTETSLFASLHKCEKGMDMDMQTMAECPIHGKKQMSKKSCCKVEKKVVKSEFNQDKKGGLQVEKPHDYQMVTFFYVLVNYLFANPASTAINDSPPTENTSLSLPRLDIPVLVQSFRL